MAYGVALTLIEDHAIDLSNDYPSETLPVVDQLITVGPAVTLIGHPSVRRARVTSVDPDADYPIAAVQIRD